MKDELRDALYAVEHAGGRSDPAPFDKAIARAICTTLGITREMVEAVRNAHFDVSEGSGTWYRLTAAQWNLLPVTADALTALLDLAEEA